MIGIIDYGAGNLRSLQNAFTKIGVESTIVSSAEEIRKCDKLALPGVGAFGELMQNVKNQDLDKVIINFIESNKPFLGICLGLQVLFEKSDESPSSKGFSIFKGSVKRFNNGLKVPQMGWNRIQKEKEGKLFKGIPNDSFVYFANSFFVEPLDQSTILSKTKYGNLFCSALEKDNIFATQFHPEKSGELGLKILENFARL